jgi:CheY-like chemotaxis protein
MAGRSAPFGGTRPRGRPGDGPAGDPTAGRGDGARGPAPAARAPDPAAPRDAGDGSLRFDGCAVLVVDDCAPALRVVAEAFGRAGAAVRPCDHPAEALSAIERDPAAWALLVTDFDMPGMTGADLARVARACAPRLAVVLCSAAPDWDAGDGEPFDAVVRKPADCDALLTAARAALRRRAAAGGDA